MTSPRALRDLLTPVLAVPALLLALLVGLLGASGASAAPAATAGPTAAATPAPAPSQLVVTVTGPGGAPVDGFLGLYLWDAEEEAFLWEDDIPMAGGSPLTDAFHVTEGSYFLYFDDALASGGAGYAGGAQEPASSPTDPGVVTVTRKVGASATIAVEGPDAVVRGRVVDGRGTPVTATVSPVDEPAYEVESEADGTFEVELAPGRHELDVVPTSTTLAARRVPVEVAATSADVALGDVVVTPTATTPTTPAPTTPAPTTPGPTTPAPTTPVPTAPVPTGTLVGTVTGPDGPAVGVEVRVLRWDDTTSAFTGIGTDGTDVVDTTGAYAVTTGEPGTYTAYLATDDALAPLAPAYLGGDGTAPAGPGAPGTFTVGSTPTTLTHDVELRQGRAATGSVTDATGAPLGGASVTSYVGTVDATGALTWAEHATGLTRADGTYAVKVPASALVTFRLARTGSVTSYLGGATSLPTTAGTGTSLVSPATDDLVVGRSVLAPAAPAPVADPVAVLAPLVSGSPSVGALLTATRGTWTGVDGASFGYRWTRDGAPIVGADQASYRLTPADAGRRVAVVVTATVPGHAPASVSSIASAVARQVSTTTSRLTAARVKAARRASVVTTVAAPGAAPTGTVRVLEGTRVLASAALRSGRATLALPRLKVGKHRLTVVYAGDAAVAGSRAAVRVLRVVR